MASTTLMKLLVELGVDATDFMNDMDNAEKKAHNTGKNIAGGIGTALGGLATAAGVAMTAVSAAIVSTIQPASDLNETMSKSLVVFGDFNDQIEKMGDSAALSLGMSKNAAMAAAATYGNLFTSMGMGKDVSANMSEGLVRLAADLASFNNMDPTQVLDALRSGLSGETEPLKRLGVNINDATLKAKALELGLWDGKGALDASAKAQATYALIMAQTTNAQGDFARTSDGLANQQRILTANIENIKAALGTGLLPIIAPVVQGFNDMLGGVLGLINGTGTLDEKISGISGLLTGFINNLVSEVPNVLTIGSELVLKLVAGIVSALPGLMPAAVQLLMTLVNGIVTLLPLLLDAGLKIIIGLATGIAQALPSLIPAIVQMLLDLVMVIVENIPLLIDAAIAIVTGLIDGIINALPILIDQAPVVIMALVNGLLGAMPQLIIAGTQLLIALINGIVTNLPALIVMAINLVVELVKAIILSLPLIFDAGVEAIKMLIEGANSLGPELVDAAKAAMNGFWEGLKSKFAEIWQGIKDFAKGVADALKDALKIQSPSKVFMDLGQNVMLGFANGLESMANVPTNIVLDTSAQVSGAGSVTGGQGQQGTQFVNNGPSADEIGAAVAMHLMRVGAVG